MFHLTTSLERVGQWTPLSKLVKLDVSLIPSAASSLSGQKRCPRTTAVICLEVRLRSRRAKISVRLQDPPSAQVLLNQIHITFHNLPFNGQTNLTITAMCAIGGVLSVLGWGIVASRSCALPT